MATKWTNHDSRDWGYNLGIPTDARCWKGCPRDDIPNLTDLMKCHCCEGEHLKNTASIGFSCFLLNINPWTPKPWKMKVLHPQNMGYNPKKWRLWVPMECMYMIVYADDPSNFGLPGRPGTPPQQKWIVLAGMYLTKHSHGLIHSKKAYIMSLWHVWFALVTVIIKTFLQLFTVFCTCSLVVVSNLSVSSGTILFGGLSSNKLQG